MMTIIMDITMTIRMMMMMMMMNKWKDNSKDKWKRYLSGFVFGCLIEKAEQFEVAEQSWPATDAGLEFC